MRPALLVLAPCVLSTACGIDLTPAPGPVVQLSHTKNPSQTLLNNGKCVAEDGSGRIHVAWLEVKGPGPEGMAERGQLFISRSVDRGATFSAPAPLSPPAARLWPPKLVAAGESVFAVWHQEEGGLFKIRFAHSEDGGTSFTTLPAAIGQGAFPALDVSRDESTPKQVHVVWTDPQRPSGAAEIFLASSRDGGRSFSTPLMVSSDDGHSSWTPSVAAAGPVVHVAWTDERDDIDKSGELHDCGLRMGGGECREEEYYRRSTDGGQSFPRPEVRLTFDPPGEPNPSWCPSLAAQGDEVHITYFDHRSGDWQIYHRRSRDAGLTWEPESSLTERLGNTPDAQWIRPSLAMQGSRLNLAFWRMAPDSETVWATQSLDGGATWGRALLLSGSDHARHPAVTLGADGVPHYAWYELRNGTDTMFYRRLEAP